MRGYRGVLSRFSEKYGLCRKSNDPDIWSQKIDSFLDINRASFSDDLITRWMKPLEEKPKSKYNNVLDWNLTNDDLLSCASNAEDNKPEAVCYLPLRRALGREDSQEYQEDSELL